MVDLVSKRVDSEPFNDMLTRKHIQVWGLYLNLFYKRGFMLEVVTCLVNNPAIYRSSGIYLFIHSV